MTFWSSRRRWLALLAASPLLSFGVQAQVTQTTPPLGSPQPAPPNATPTAKLDKAMQDVRGNGQQLAALEVPMNIEPAFSFRA